MFFHLPPVGTPVSLRASEADMASFEAMLSPYAPVFYGSGTSALAAALIAACKLKPGVSPEVLIPAYACPDLVSAVVYAGATPVLVDLEPDRPWMDLQQVKERLNSNTVAIVAVHLFGILERIAALKSIADNAGILLIEDSAQAFPGGQEQPFWSADLVILSFGRGKPVNALGGGALLSKNERLTQLLPVRQHTSSSGRLGSIKNTIKIMAYNRLIHPGIYWVPNSLPFLHLGETRYQPLSGISGLSLQGSYRVASNAKRYQRDDQRAQTDINAALNDSEVEIINLPAVCEQAVNRRLLRYPLLIEEAIRDNCLQALNAAGLGATRMYPASLPAIAGLDNVFRDQGVFAEAERFSRRIITLPVHPGVRAADVEAMMAILKTLH